MLAGNRLLFKFTSESAKKIKISSWNVNGLRSVISKNKLQEYIKYSQPDILCLNETRIDNQTYERNKVKEIIPNTHHYLNQCKTKKGYSGVGVITKLAPLNVYYDFSYMEGTKDQQHSKEGRLITLQYQKFFIVNVYKPNAGDMLIRLPFRRNYDTLFNQYIKLLNQTKPTIIVGDFNVAPEENDLAFPERNTNRAGFTLTERTMFWDLLKLEMVDGFRHFYPHKRAYTWWSNRDNARSKDIGWRIDHIVFHKSLADRIKNVQIQKYVYGSDHCPIEATMDF